MCEVGKCEKKFAFFWGGWLWKKKHLILINMFSPTVVPNLGTLAWKNEFRNAKRDHLIKLGFAFRMGVNPGSCWACQTHPHLKQSVTIFAVSKSRLLFLEAHLRIWLSWKMLNKTLNCVGSNPASASHEDAQSVCFIPSRYYHALQRSLLTSLKILRDITSIQTNIGS